MKKRIAVIINGDLSINRQGQINSAINRVKHLMQMDVFNIDVYCIQEYDSGLLRWLHKNNRIKKQIIWNVEGVPVRAMYKRMILMDLIFGAILKITPPYSSYCFHKIARQFKNYDLIIGHSTVGGIVAKKVNESYNIPYCVVWHGSDIHTKPESNKYTKKLTNSILANASANIFVSLSLLNDAQRVFDCISNPRVAYNAPSEAFVKFCNHVRAELRKKEDVSGKKVVAFVGNLVPVKNVFTLPKIFQKIIKENKNVVFWIIGHGMYSEKLKKKMIEADVECRFWGNLQPEAMPSVMNCIDVLVLPSLNESFGMVLVEAIACGANAVGSNRGGIPEVLGEENCFELNEGFEDRISERIVYMLNNHVEQNVKPEFNWHRTAKDECMYYMEILTKSEKK